MTVVPFESPMSRRAVSNEDTSWTLHYHEGKRSETEQWSGDRKKSHVKSNNEEGDRRFRLPILLDSVMLQWDIR